MKEIESLFLSYWEYFLHSFQLIIELFIVINWSFHPSILGQTSNRKCVWYFDDQDDYVHSLHTLKFLFF